MNDRTAQCFGGPLDGASYAVHTSRVFRVAVPDPGRFAMFSKMPQRGDEALAPMILTGTYELDPITCRWEWIPPGHVRPIV